MTTTTFETIDSAFLVTATGGAGAPVQQGGAEQPETTRDLLVRTGREYASACVNGAGQALLFGGKPKSWKDAATTAGMGCAMGMGTKALDQLTGAMFGTPPSE
jgi:hypothetical protein